jgi:hypothetical protein
LRFGGICGYTAVASLLAKLQLRIHNEETIVCRMLQGVERH